MNRVTQLDPAQATGSTKPLFDQVRAELGVVPNFFRVLGTSPAAFRGYLSFNTALGDGILSTELRSKIALAVAEGNLCGYCLSAHTFLSKKIGFSDEEIADARRANAATTRVLVTDPVLARTTPIEPPQVGHRRRTPSREAIMAKLFESVTVGVPPLRHRVAMARLTRMRGEPTRLRNERMREYIASGRPTVGSLSRRPLRWRPGATVSQTRLASTATRRSRAGAERARRAGFDAVEVYGAGGHLPDQFPQDSFNHCVGDYGGLATHRARFLFEVTEAAIQSFGPARVGVRVSPSNTAASTSDGDPRAIFGYVAERLDAMRIAWPHVVELRTDGVPAPDAPSVRHLRQIFHRGALIAVNGFHVASAKAALAGDDADLFAFGRQSFASPDLPKRLSRGLPLNPYDRTTFYGGDARGYTESRPPLPRVIPPAAVSAAPRGTCLVRNARERS